VGLLAVLAVVLPLAVALLLIRVSRRRG
jgi:hypothetical protein